MTRAWAIALLGLAGCSAITDRFHECNTNRDCQGGRACVQSYCVTVNCSAGVGAPDAGNAIALGAVLPLSDTTGKADQAQVVDFEAFELALSEINQRGVGGRPFAVYPCDSEGDTTLLENEINYLVAQKKIVAVLTSHSSQVLAAAPGAVAQGVLVMTATATSPEITALNANYPLPSGSPVRMVWRTAPSDVYQGKVIENQIVENPRGDTYLANVNTLGILYVDDPYGQGLSQAVQSAVAADPLGAAKVVHAVQYEPGADPTAALSQLNGFAPDLVLAIGFPSDLVTILDQSVGLSALSRSRWFFTDSAEDPALLTGMSAQALALVQGALGTAPAQGAGPAYTAFAQRFQARYGLDPATTSFTAHSYDAMYLLALGAAYAVGPGPTYAGPVTGPLVASGLTQLSAASGPLFQLGPTDFTNASSALEQGTAINVDGASGSLDFDPATGEAPSDISIWRVQNQTFVPVATVPPP